jgi:hypothetical protein
MKLDTKKYLLRNWCSLRRDLSFDDLVSAANAFFEAVNSPIALGAYLRLKYSPKEYLDMDIDPNNYLDLDRFRLDYQVIKLLSKYEDFPSGISTREVAERNFIQAEKQCRETNAFFESERSPFIGRPVESAIFYGAQRKISRILGNAPSIHEVVPKLGPGANVGLSKYTSVFDKLNAPITLTSGLAPFASEILAEMPSLVASKAGITALPTPSLYKVKCPVQLVSGSKLSFVPKNAKTDRAICIEPLLNSMIQLGLGRRIRNRLSMAGCNLNSQSRNQQLARIGSLTNDLATIDLSSASDTISYQVVSRLLPPPWVDLLEAARCASFTYEGKTFPFEKFSSMGNGYTFELESLIFLALARATCDYLNIASDEVNVYGDDIIIPVKAAAVFHKILKFCGFTVNTDKSFYSGPFRESCGKDWFLGQDVRPLFIKKRITNQQLMIWCNRLFILSDHLVDHRYEKFYYSLKSLIPKPFHALRGPVGFGDGHFVSDPIPGLDTSHSYLRRGWDGKGYFTLSSRAILRKYTSIDVYKAALYNADFISADIENPTTSHLSERGIAVFSTRGHTRNVLLRSFHPWN